MSAIILPRRWAQQPAGLVEIDWTHPLARGVYQAILPGIGVNAVSRSLFAATGTKTRASPHGLGRGFGSTYGVATTDLLSAPAGPSNNAPRSYLIQALTLAAATSGRYFCRSKAATNNAGERFVIDAANTVRLNRTVGGVDVANSRWTTTFGVPHTWVVTNDAVTAANTALYEDGRLLTRAADTALTNAQNDTDTFWIGNSAPGTQPASMICTLIVIINRLLSASEARELSRNAWQIFKPISTKIYTGATVAGGAFQAAWARNRSQVIGAGAH